MLHCKDKFLDVPNLSCNVVLKFTATKTLNLYLIKSFNFVFYIQRKNYVYLIVLFVQIYLYSSSRVYI